ncbi:putative tRNA binding protein [Dioszegia hungarica]|uniref:tRNA binding protein n=1 Tax=Dioszegia hungarica TaxID=4972 RepID=A0AA38LTH8_9TREE|nr:putative tRNA binding protein [Dioszegia hungarica]KAI9636897.1 putative tRNA binding protein [Dioszegia hungarica]
MSVSEFVAAAEKADSSLMGSNEKDQQAIQELSTETEGLAKDVASLNSRLTPLTYLYSNQPSSADVSLYCHLHPTFLNLPTSAHPSHPALTRYFLQIQSLPPVQSAHSSLPNSFPPVDINIADLAIPEREVIDLKKEKKAKKPAAAVADGAAEKAGEVAGQAKAATEGVVAQAQSAVAGAAGTVSGAAASAAGAVQGALAGAAAAFSTAAGDVKAAVVGEAEGEAAPVEAAKDGKKKEKKAKPAKAQPVKEAPTGPMPSMIDLRVGKVLDVKKHPEADSLYVEQIDVGEAEPRTVCSGLVKYMTEDQIRGATVIVVCNLKPVTMRGVKSFAMLLCASSSVGKDVEGGIEFVVPPEGSKAGERVYFEGEKYENAKPEEMLNPKKKVFETIQPDFTTLDNLDAAWIDPETKTVHKLRTKDGVLRAPTLKGAHLS